MIRHPVLLLLIAAAVLGGCSALDPYATVARIAHPGQPTGQRVGICYNTLRTPLPQVQAEAQRECAADTTAQQVETDWYLDMCPLLVPARATFVCVAKK
jgi:hypothetical protein